MRRTKAPKILGILSLAAALSGCIGIPLHISSVEDDLPGKAASVVAGESDRTQVRQSLGEPLISSRYWRFDAFRITEWNAGVVVFGGGVPVPAWGKEDGYILVAYDEHERASEVQYGLRSSGSWIDPPSAWRDAVVNVRDLQLRAAGRQVFLAVPPERRDRYLGETVPGAACRVLIGALDALRDARLSVDGQPGPILPETLIDTLLPLTLAPGTHALEISGPASTTAELQCEAGAILFVALAPTSGSFKSRSRSMALTVSPVMPDGFRDQALLIWGNGQWLVEAEAAPGASGPNRSARDRKK